MSRGLTKKSAMRIIKDILDSKNGLYVFKIPAEYKVNPMDVFPFIEQYKNWINYSNGKLTIHDYSRAAVRLAVNSAHRSSSEISERANIPISFEGDRLKLDNFYLPKRFKRKDRVN